MLVMFELASMNVISSIYEHIHGTPLSKKKINYDLKKFLTTKMTVLAFWEKKYDLKNMNAILHSPCNMII